MVQKKDGTQYYREVELRHFFWDVSNSLISQHYNLD